MVRMQAKPLGPDLLALQRAGMHCDVELRLCRAKAAMHYAVLAARCTALRQDADTRSAGETRKVVTLASEKEDVFSSVLSDSARQLEVLEKFIEYLYGLEIALPPEFSPLLTCIMSRLGCMRSLQGEAALEEISTLCADVPVVLDAGRTGVAEAADDIVLERSEDPNDEEKMCPASGSFQQTVTIFDGRVEKASRSHSSYKELLQELSNNTTSLNYTKLKKQNNSNQSCDGPLPSPAVTASLSQHCTSLSIQEADHEHKERAVENCIKKEELDLRRADEQNCGRCGGAKGHPDEDFTCVPDLSVLTIGIAEESNSESKCVYSIESLSNNTKNWSEIELKNSSSFLKTFPSVAVCNIDSQGSLSTSYPDLSRGLKKVFHNHSLAQYKQSSSQPVIISDSGLNLIEDMVSGNSSFSIVCEPARQLKGPFEAVKSCVPSGTEKLVIDTATSNRQRSDQTDFVPEELDCVSGTISDSATARDSLAAIRAAPPSSSTKMAVAVSTLVDTPFASGGLARALQPSSFLPISGMLPSAQGGLQCGQCQASFRKCSDLVKHVLSDLHFTETCPICQAKAPDLESQRSHFVLHDSPLPFFCHGCDLRFRTRAHLAMHAPKHSSARPFSCPECSRAFKWRHALQAHLLTHRPMGHLLCDVCGFSSNYITTFKAHLQQHSGEAFSCTQPGCSFKAFRKDNLKAHLATHSNVRPHQCEVCGTSFSLFRNLRRHMRVHSGLRLQCSTCSFTTTRADKLRCHISAKHRAALDPTEPGPQSGPAEQTPTQELVAQYSNVDEVHGETDVLESELVVEKSIPAVNDHVVLSVSRQDIKNKKSGDSDGVAFGRQSGRKVSFGSTRIKTKLTETYSGDDCFVESCVNELTAETAQSSSYGQNKALLAKKPERKRVLNKKSKKKHIEYGIKRRPRLIFPKPPPVSTSSIAFLEDKPETLSHENMVAVAHSDVQ